MPRTSCLVPSIFIHLTFFTTCLLTSTKQHLDAPFRTVSRGSPGPSLGSPGLLGSVPRRFREFLKSLEGPKEVPRREKAGESWRKLEKASRESPYKREGWRKLEKASGESP